MIWVRLGALGAALGLLACDAHARIRLLEPDDRMPQPGMDAGGVPPQPEAAGSAARDAGPGPRRPPDLQPPMRQDSGLPEALNAGAGSPAASFDALVLRYDFSGKGDVLPDLVGDRDARLLGGTTLSPDRGYIRLDSPTGSSRDCTARPSWPG